MDNSSKKPMTQAEAAEFLGVSLRTLLKLRKQDGLPFARVGAQIRFERDAIIAWMRGQSSATKAGA